MKWIAYILAIPLLGVAGTFAAEPAPVLQSLMKDGAKPLSEQLWEIAARGADDEGKPDASRLSDVDWQTLASAARSMKGVAALMSDPARLEITEPGGMLGDDVSTGATAEMVSSYIAGEPKIFTGYARDLDAAAGAFLAAVAKKDAVRLMKASDDLGLVCEACHAKFWYPLS